VHPSRNMSGSTVVSWLYKALRAGATAHTWPNYSWVSSHLSAQGRTYLTLNCFTSTGGSIAGTFLAKYAFNLLISMLARTSPYSPPIFLGCASFGIVVERKLEEGVFARLAIDRRRLHKDNRFAESRPLLKKCYGFANHSAL